MWFTTRTHWYTLITMVFGDPWFEAFSSATVHSHVVYVFLQVCANVLQTQVTPAWQMCRWCCDYFFYGDTTCVPEPICSVYSFPSYIILYIYIYVCVCIRVHHFISWQNTQMSVFFRWPVFWCLFRGCVFFLWVLVQIIRSFKAFRSKVPSLKDDRALVRSMGCGWTGCGWTG